MEKLLNSDSVKSALTSLGWNQKQLAEELEVTSQAVTNWLKGADFPRPNKLLKLSTTLGLSFDELVQQSASKPIVAFRKKGSSITTDKHIQNASHMGKLLKSIVEFLPTSNHLRTTINTPSLDYAQLQAAAAEVRSRIEISSNDILEYNKLINEFHSNGALIIPVMWGSKQHHGNALHILLPEENVTFIYLNLDTHLEDFKFWMAHELAHVYTPDHAGTEFGEDFADAFAGALLFPEELSAKAYKSCSKAKSQKAEISTLLRYADDHSISIYSVFCEINKFAEYYDLPPLKLEETDIHAYRNWAKGDLVSSALYGDGKPSPQEYIASTTEVFSSNFFQSLKHMLNTLGTGPGYIQQILDISIKDATALYEELVS